MAALTVLLLTGCVPQAHRAGVSESHRSPALGPPSSPGASVPPRSLTLLPAGSVAGRVPGHAGPPRRVAVSVHSSVSPQGLPTWGRADLDGDGRPDTVVVRTSGLVTARLGSRSVRAHLLPDSTLRLQGFTDLTGDGRVDVLVAETALGCASGYRLCATGTSVLTLVDHRLRHVRFPNDRPQWDDGQGDLFAGWVCRPGGPIEIDVNLTSPTTYLLTRTRYRVTSLRARVVGRATERGTGTYAGAAALTRTRCPGLDPGGWAPERGPLG